VITIIVDPKIAALIMKLIVMSGLTILEAIDEVHDRTGVSKSILKNFISQRRSFFKS
jgi:hypothetical protein